MKCCNCDKEIKEEKKYTPFCSKRCQMLDFGNWADEKYVVASTPASTDSEELEASQEGY